MGPTGRKPLTQKEQDELDVQKLLYQHSKPYLQRYSEWEEENPWKARALDIGISMIPVEGIAAAVLKRAPGMLGSLGKLYDMSRRPAGGGWGEGAQLAPEYRSEVKKQLNKEVRESLELPALKSKEFGGLGAAHRWEAESPTVKEVAQGWQKIIDEGGEQGPYKVTGFRGEGSPTASGRGPVPGRGRFHAPYPTEAASYTGYRDPKESIRHGRDTPHYEKLKRISADELELKKPLVVEYGDLSYEGLKDKLKLTEKDKALWKASRQYDKKSGWESPDWQTERFWSRKAKEAGYDSILVHDPEPKVLGPEHQKKMRLITLQDLEPTKLP